jgi:anti-sigma regulatory factor (Ser/Thr protein kinase)
MLMSVNKPHEVQLPRDTRAPRQARELLVECFGAMLRPGALDTAKLLTSELVTNAVVHGEGDIRLRAQLDEDRLLVEVIDQGCGFERVFRDRARDELGGWGLRLVDTEASRWGVHEGITHVWFELERPGPRLVSNDKQGVSAR